jgi:hypothetical protein
MRDAVLHLISNKSNGFNVPCFPVYSSFTPYTATAQETVLRDKLFINSSNYHLINSLLAVYSFIDILSEFRETSRTFNFSDLPTGEVSIVNATYGNTDTVNFNILNIPNSFPSPNYFNWEIKYQDDAFIVLHCCDTVSTIPYTLTSVTQNSTTYRLLTADWPVVTGIKGGFILDPALSWSYGNSITLTVPPVVFPYEQAIKLVDKLAETAHVLNGSGLARNYYNAQSYIEKYALLMLAIARPDLRNPKIVTVC